MIRLLTCILLASCASSTSAHAPTRAYRVTETPRYPNTIDVGDVEDEPMAIAFNRFAQLARAGAKRITLRIDSFGGSIFLGNRWGKAVEDMKKANGIRVTCIVDGAAYSMAAVILESSLCDLRLATERSTILFHNSSGGAQGNAEDLKQAAEFMQALDAAMALAIATRIGMPLEAYRAKIAHTDWTMAVPEALRLNVIDGVVSPADIDPPARPLPSPAFDL